MMSDESYEFFLLDVLDAFEDTMDDADETPRAKYQNDNRDDHISFLLVLATS